MAAEPTGRSVATVLGLDTVGARLLVTLFIAVQAVLVVSNLDDVHVPARSLTALGLTAAATVLVTLRSGEVMPAWLALAVGTLTIAVAVLVTWNLDAGASTGYAGWHWGAITFILFLMALRGRVVLTWLFYAAMVAVTFAWALTAGPGALAAVGLLDRHAGMLLVATIAAYSLRRVARRSDDLAAAQVRLAERDAATRTRLAEQAVQSAMLDRLARPALEKIASDAPLGPEDRRDFVLLEALLRDRIRASALLTPAVADAAWRARSAGADVVLLDDRGEVELPEEAAGRIQDAVLRALETPGLERLTARLLPAGRDELATVVTSAAGGRARVSIPTAPPEDGAAGAPEGPGAPDDPAGPGAPDDPAGPDARGTAPGPDDPLPGAVPSV